jgi:hypothetical protein
MVYTVFIIFLFLFTEFDRRGARILHSRLHTEQRGQVRTEIYSLVIHRIIIIIIIIIKLLHLFKYVNIQTMVLCAPKGAFQYVPKETIYRAPPNVLDAPKTSSIQDLLIPLSHR